MNWQSIRSVMPPWPGMLSPKSLILKVRFKPEAKKPPNGAMREANVAKIVMWNCMGAIQNVRLMCVQSGSWCGLGVKTGFGTHCKPVQ